MRGPAIVWHDVVVKKAAGLDEKLFLGRDESPKQIATRLVAKRARDVLAQLVPAERWYVDKLSGRISARWTPVLQLQVAEEVAPQVSWCAAGLAKLGLQRSASEARVLAAARPEESFDVCV